ncbi:MAG: C-GCAxxG-C-C family protein [Deltaproteobacteria bacterium]|nr:C-GCAxxG-C-C family protein [Candidatus Zymogenaceae bacterium]
MWEAFRFEDDSILWAGIPFLGGIGGKQDAPCGAVSTATMALGLVCRVPGQDKAAVKQARHRARAYSGDFVTRFAAAFSGLSCRQLIGYDFSEPGAYREFLESGIWKDKCLAYVQFAVTSVYEAAQMNQRHDRVEPVIVYTKRGCPYCERALRDLTERRVAFEEIVIDDDPAARETVMRLSGGKGIVPILVSRGTEVTVGFGGG